MFSKDVLFNILGVRGDQFFAGVSAVVCLGPILPSPLTTNSPVLSSKHLLGFLIAV